jgi:hypothetical protein
MRKALVALVLLAIVALAGCSSSSSSSGSGTPGTQSSSPSTSSAPGPVATGSAGIAAATAQIKKNWATFFKSSTAHATSVSLLQDGASLGAAVRFAAKIARQEKVSESAVVHKVTFTPDGMSAAIVYTLYGGKAKLLPKADGTAVLDGGVWKVSKVTFCQLVTLGAGGKAVPGCPT